MIRFESYVKFYIEGQLSELEEKYAGAKKSARRASIEEERTRLLADYDTFIEIAAGLPRFDSGLFDRIFPRRSKQGELYLRVKPQDTREMITFLDLLEAHPLAHREGDRIVTPWTSQNETHRIFPYTFVLQLKPNLFCRLVWCYAYRSEKFVHVRLHLPDQLAAAAVDIEIGTLRDEMFVAGLSPYVYTQTNAYGKRVGLHFPKAYLRDAGGGFRLLGWRDIPLLREAERSQKEPNSESSVSR